MSWCVVFFFFKTKTPIEGFVSQAHDQQCSHLESNPSVYCSSFAAAGGICMCCRYWHAKSYFINKFSFHLISFSLFCVNGLEDRKHFSLGCFVISGLLVSHLSFFAAGEMGLRETRVLIEEEEERQPCLAFQQHE